VRMSAAGRYGARVQPLEVLKAVNAAFCRQDAAAMVALFSDDAIVADHRQGGLGRWQGRQELLAYYTGICEAARELREQLEVVEDRGDVIAAHCIFTARLSEDGPAAEVSLNYGLVATIADGLIQRIDLYQDGAAAQAEMPATS
jgi:ketosteroid isomerase-like protein